MNFVQELIILYSIVIAGYIAKRYRILDADSDRMLTQLIFYITLPALILYSMDFSFSTELLREFGLMILFSLYALGIASLIAYLLSINIDLPKDRKGVFQGLIIFGNQGFLGYAVCYSMLGQMGIMYASVFNLAFLLLIWTYGIYIMAENQLTFSWKIIVYNHGIIATLLGLTILVLPYQWPRIIVKLFETLGNPTTPLSMLLIGSIIAENSYREVLKICANKSLWITVLVKLILMPLLLLPLVYIPVSFPLLATAVLLTAMPSAPTIPLFAQKYGADARFGSVGVTVSTFLSLFSLPLIYAILTAAFH